VADGLQSRVRRQRSEARTPSGDFQPEARPLKNGPCGLAAATNSLSLCDGRCYRLYVGLSDVR